VSVRLGAKRAGMSARACVGARLLGGSMNLTRAKLWWTRKIALSVEKWKVEVEGLTKSLGAHNGPDSFRCWSDHHTASEWRFV
jgi:hypothetical protein